MSGIHNEGVAIVGMAGRFPGARDINEFWQNLIAGRECISCFTPEQLDASVPADLRAHPRYVRARGVMADADRFDPAFFGISPTEALLMDPQQRVMLELCWNALEHAGADPSRFGGSIGVYAGTSNNTYRKRVESRADLLRAAGEFAATVANEKDYVATRVAHRMDLRGPALSIHTACSTSLVAIAQAWYALMSWQCDLALAGGINIVVPQESGYLPVEGGMESADGHCRPFDAQANGTVFSSGGAVVALKRLGDAIENGDTIWAVIRGVAVNNDGGDKASFSAPSVRGQAAVIRQALGCAGVGAESIGYVEAHGTGTPLGDPIEVEALVRAYRDDTPQKQFCWLGSVKGNVGHLVAGAGVAGVIKAALTLHHERIPPSLHFQNTNPEIDLEASPFKVADREIEWPRNGAPRRAAVSSFGVGGTNAHVILEEAPQVATRDAPRDGSSMPALLVLSAHDEAALQRRAEELAQALADHCDEDLPDVAATLALGRKPMRMRGAVVARGIEQARERLMQLAAQRAQAKPRVVFLFPGQGSQHAGMARELVESEPVFRETFERCCALASRHLDRDLRELVLPAPDRMQEAQLVLAETRYTQPALFAVEYALAELWESWGVHADAMIGHSSGEYVAACRAGVFTLEQAIELMIARASAMYAQPRGAMLALRVAERDLPKQLPRNIEVAAVNAPLLTVLAGAEDAIEHCAARLAEADVASTRLQVSHAFHSSLMEGALPAFRRAFDGVQARAPQRTFYSCVSGVPIESEQATSAEYWCSQLRKPVRFADALQHALAQTEGSSLLLEVGPGQALTGLTRRMLEGRGRAVASLGSVARPGDAAEHLQRALGECWSAGVAPDWQAVFARHPTRRVPLPVYPFQGERYWIDAVSAAPSNLNPEDGKAMPVPLAAAQREQSAASRRASLCARLRGLFENLSGQAIGPEAYAQGFLALGLDSLALTQAALEIERNFGVKLKFRRLMEDLDSIQALAAMLDEVLPPEAAPAQAPEVATDITVAPGDSALAQLVQTQMAMLQQQGQLLAKLATARSGAAGAVVSATSSPAPEAPRDPEPVPANLVERPFGASARIHIRHGDRLDAAQRAFIESFTRRYNARTGKSKAFSQRHRALMADPRVVTGFNPLWKELVYPIVVERSRGARLWDIDGNEYIDLLNGFGSNFLGYRPDFIVDALKAQIEAGYEIGPQHVLAAEVSALISEMTGMPRVAFCNTGSEAVMGAMRIARAVTGRKLVAIFSGSYHGIFDEVIVRSGRDLRSYPAAPGIPPEATENVLVLEYGSEEALRVITERAHELAAVMIEPVQGRNPALQPRAFVQELRKVCDAGGSALIFDEVVTGFRVEPGGAQAFYGVRADIASYGKIIGGGLPFAAIAGSAKWMDALDGGEWRFDDDSYPEAGVTYFAGTFVRHPLALAAARAALLHVKQRGPALQRELNERTARLASRLNAFFAARRAPMQALAFSSLWRVNVDADQACAGLYYYALRERGLHVYEQFNCFLSEAHGEAEVREIAERIEAAVDELMRSGVLTPRKASERLLARPEVRGAGKLPIESNTPAEFPLTDAQAEKWLACQYGGQSSLCYNESFVLMLEGPLQRNALEDALQHVISRHDAFTLSFAADGRLQRTGLPQPPPLQFLDMAGDDADERMAAHCARALQQPFDLQRAPLIRTQLLRLAPERHGLLIIVHHLVSDGWSEAVLLDELAQTYNALVAGEPATLETPASWRAFALEEAERRRGPEAERQLQFWRGCYATIPEPLALPVDHPRTQAGEMNFAAATVRHNFPPELVARLRKRAREQGVTFYSLLLAGAAALLARLSGQRDFTIAIPFAGQALTGNQNLIGDCLSSLPLRVSVDDEQPFDNLASAMNRALLDAGENQDLTIHTLLHALDLPAGAQRPRLADVVFCLNPRLTSRAFTGLRHHVRDCERVALFQELFFNLNEIDGGLALDLHYRTAFFEEATIRRWISHYEVLLAAGIERSDTGLAALPLMSASNRLQVLHGWNDSARDYDSTAGLPSLVTAQAARTPERTAVECEDGTLSYAQLERRADAIARALLSRGVRRGELVGICMERGLDLLPALLGIMKSGAAYVPLDPGFPAERLHYMAEHSGLRNVVVLRAESTPDVVAQGRALLELERLPDRRRLIRKPLPVLSGDDLAYVLYTSGSTGQPKGVRILHRNLVNFLTGMADRPGISADDVLCAITTLSFDIAGLELYLPLTVGARIALASERLLADPHGLMQLIHERGATMLQTTPSLLRLLLDGGRIEGIRGLKLLVGGEALPRDLAEAALPRCRELWNLYGPTETTIWSTASRVEHGSGPLPLGTPIANTQIYVLDPRGQPVAPGVAGEIWIGGAGVADGYQGCPELTAERFLPNPFVDAGIAAPPARVYRTGDMGALHDGVLHFFGRADDQIKLRGYRIEPGDIEAVALTVPGVREAVAVAREFSASDKRLVLYVAGSAGATQVREQLRAGLPAYMLPQHIEVLDALPKTPNGKTDRKALPLPSSIASVAALPSERKPERPLGPLERTFLQIWRDLLRVQDIGLDDNFFDMGGDSLLAVRVFQRAQELTGVNLPLSTLLIAPTIAGQVAAFRAAGAGEPGGLASDPAAPDPWALLVPLQPHGSLPPLFCVHAVGGNVLGYKPLAQALGEDRPFYGIQAVGLDGITPPLESLPAMAARYCAEIRSLQPQGPYFLAGRSMGGMIAYEIARQFHEQGEQIALLALFDTYGPGNHHFELQRAGSLRRMGHRWHERWERLRHTNLHKFREWISEFAYWRGLWFSDAVRLRWARATGRTLPHALRYRVLLQCNERAYYDYVPPPYPGKVTLFRAAEHPPEMAASYALGWENAGVDLEVIQMSGDHDSLIEQPSLVPMFRAAMLRAQAGIGQHEQRDVPVERELVV